ncbi:MAG TPA: hypothetical protein DDW52_10135 [Planctomycetaceae bacterium]|nr:hypothetical protein [Planctomycetaceae bacterium]
MVKERCLVALATLLAIVPTGFAQDGVGGIAHDKSRKTKHSLEEIARLQREVEAIKNHLGLQDEVDADISRLLSRHPEIRIAADYIQDRHVMRDSARDVRQLRKLIEAGELWPISRLEFLYAQAEREAASTGKKLRNTACGCEPTNRGKQNGGCATCSSLASVLREQVTAAFNLRLQLQQAILRETESKLEATRQQLSARVDNASRIIEQRIEHILSGASHPQAMVQSHDLTSSPAEVEKPPRDNRDSVEQRLEARVDIADKLERVELVTSELSKAIQVIDSETNNAKLKASSEDLAKVRLQLSYLGSQEEQLKKLSETDEAKKLAAYNKSGGGANAYEVTQLHDSLSRKVQAIVLESPSISHESIGRALDSVSSRKKFLTERETVLMEIVGEARRVKAKVEHLSQELENAQEEFKRLSDLKARIDLSLLDLDDDISSRQPASSDQSWREPKSSPGPAP